MTARIRRSRTVVSLLATALMATLALAIGGTTGTPAAASITPDCVWHPLSLLNGWQSSQAQYGSGDPSYCLDAGMVYLSGSLYHPSGNNSEFAVLPPEAVPASVVYLSVYTFGGAAGILKIYPDGEILAHGGSAPQFTSLAGVSFPMAGSQWAEQPLPLWNGWQSAQTQYDTGDPSYFMTGGVVHLAGSLQNTGPGVGDGFSLMNADTTPAICEETNSYAYNGAITSVTLDPSTSLYLMDDPYGNVTNAAAFTSLSGISYPAAGATFQPLPVQPGWAAQDGQNCPTGPPSYYVSDQIVYLTGSVLNTHGGTGGVAAVLPPAIRPKHALFFTVNTEGEPHANLEITPGGAVDLWGGTAPFWDSLGGISYPQSS